MRAPPSGLPSFIVNELSFIFILLRKIKDLTAPAIPPNVFVIYTIIIVAVIIIVYTLYDF